MTKSLGLASSLLLAPLIGVSDSLPKALGFWVLSALIVSLFGWGMKPLRSHLDARRHLIASLFLAATLVSCAQLILRAFALALYNDLGVYLALISLQCVLLEHSGFFQAGLNKARCQLWLLLAILLITLSLLRALLSNGTGATLVPSGFILLGLLLAGRQAWTHYSKSH